MHPNAYLRALWRNETLEQVFVAMSFEPRFKDRFETIIKPAVEGEPIAGRTLKAFRVDNSKTGDSILTEIVANIAHSRLVLADVSAIDEGRFTGATVRNSNVLYEVGVALACRLPSEVLLVRDDNKRFLFDVSSVPHLTVDFTSPDSAIALLRTAMADRINETSLLDDARVDIAARSLTQDELELLETLSSLPANQAREVVVPNLRGLSIPVARGLSGLLAKGCLRAEMVNDAVGSLLYSVTPFGYTLARAAKTLLERVNVYPATDEQKKD